MRVETKFVERIWDGREVFVKNSDYETWDYLYEEYDLLLEILSGDRLTECPHTRYFVTISDTNNGGNKIEVTYTSEGYQIASRGKKGVPVGRCFPTFVLDMHGEFGVTKSFYVRIRKDKKK